MKSVSQDMSKTKIANQKYPLKTFDTIPMLKPYTPLLDGVDSPADLKKMSTAQLQQLADELREFLLYTTGVSGGHFGSNLGVVELPLHCIMSLIHPKTKLSGT